MISEQLGEKKRKERKRKSSIDIRFYRRLKTGRSASIFFKTHARSDPFSPGRNERWTFPQPPVNIQILNAPLTFFGGKKIDGMSRGLLHLKYPHVSFFKKTSFERAIYRTVERRREARTTFLEVPLLAFRCDYDYGPQSSVCLFWKHIPNTHADFRA